jgi:signal transduction histidine kinase
MRRPPVAAVVFGVALAIGLVVPIVAFAFYTRATIESDVSAVLRRERIAAAQLAAAVVRQRFESAAAALMGLAAQPDFREAASRRDRQALDALLLHFYSPRQFPDLGVVSAQGEIVAQSWWGASDASFSPAVAASVSSVGPESPWAYLGREARTPSPDKPDWAGGTIVVPLTVGSERLAVYGVLAQQLFTPTLLPTPLPRGRSALVLNTSGRVILLMDEFGSTASKEPAISGLHQALPAGTQVETATLGGEQRLVVRATVFSGALELYLLDTPAIALAAVRRLKDPVTVGASLAAAFAVVVAIVLAMLVSRLRRQRGEIARLAVSEERLRFARDLHDVLGRSFTLIALKSELATRLLPGDREAATREITDVQLVAREALRDVRQAVVGYRQPSLAVELSGARSALEGVGIECHILQDVGNLPEQIDSLFAWAVREGVTNVIRHSGAAHCEIRLSRGEREVQVEVLDDGTGEAVGTSGQGLQGLKERAMARGGNARAVPLPEKGFSLRIAVPLSPK